MLIQATFSPEYIENMLQVAVGSSTCEGCGPFFGDLALEAADNTGIFLSSYNTKLIMIRPILNQWQVV